MPKCVVCVLVTIWVTVGLAAWSVVVSGCAGTYDPSLIEDVAADVDGGVE